MKKFFTLMTAVVLFCSAAEAKNWRINNDPEAKADFLSINAAMASTDVYPGDVLYLDPGCHLPQQTISKGVTIIGTGFNLNGAVEEAFVEGFNIKASDIKLMSINITGKTETASGVSNFTLERCKTRDLSFINSGTNLKVLNCYVSGHINGYDRGVTVRNTIVLGQIYRIQNGSIKNCVVISDCGNEASTYYSYYVLYSITNTSITNNIIINTNTKSTVSGNTTTFYNHQTIYNVSETDANSINNNILSNDSTHTFAIYKTNQFIGAKIEDVFEWEGSLDERFKLKEGSPALGAGANAVDCGVYGGAYSYVVSGLPKFIPYIVESNIPTTPTDGKLNITLKIKSQNE